MKSSEARHDTIPSHAPGQQPEALKSKLWPEGTRNMGESNFGSMLDIVDTARGVWIDVHIVGLLKCIYVFPHHSKTKKKYIYIYTCILYTA